MRKHRTLPLESAGGRPGSQYEPTRPPAFTTMIDFRFDRGSLHFSLLFSILILLSGWMMVTEAAPWPALASSRFDSREGRTSQNHGKSSHNNDDIRQPLNQCLTTYYSTALPAKTSISKPSSPCRYTIKERYGTLTTPGFPAPFPTPFQCSWFIDATGFEPDSFITLYLTQMYLTRGVKAVQYSFRNETHSLGRKELDELHTLRPRPYSVYRIKARYLEVQVNLHELVNANLRVEHRLLDVYGFNITYEIQTNDSRIRSDTCNAVNCTFNGHCYANHNYSQFQCSCLPGFSGKYCQFGPDCNPEKGINVCRNGGTCGYRTGLTVVRCSCPPNYNGSLCEYRREFIPAKECLSRFRLNCSHHCVVTDKGGAVCRCPLDQALKSDMLTCYPLVPLRIMGQVKIPRPAAMNDSHWVDGVTATFKTLVDEYTATRLALSTLHLKEPNSSLLQFVLWTAESYNISWRHSAPVTAAVKYNRNNNLGHASFFNKKRTPRNEPTQPSFGSLTIPHQFNVSYHSFINQINSRPWKIYGEMINVRVDNASIVPALLIEWVKLDVKNQVKEGYPFTVACNANGSEKVKLQWFKDGHPVEAAFAMLRNMSVFVHQAQDLRGFFTLYLEVKQASIADRGEYECRANDWDQSVRKSVFLDVITPPILDVMPINPTFFSGTAVNLTCRDENHLARRTTTKYIWLKNGQPIEPSCDEIIEDLMPVGSLLKVTSIQHSTNYTCRGDNGSAPANKTTHISVVQPDRACPRQKHKGVEWLMTAVDVTNYQLCPAGYIGVAKRHCRSVEQLPDEVSLSTRVLWMWNEPDFSHCGDRYVSELYKQLKLIMLGYVVTDVESVVEKFYEFVQRKLNDIQFNHSKPAPVEQTPVPYLPGEGNALLEMAKSLEAFMSKRTHMLPSTFWNSTAINYLYALDALLSMPRDFFRPDGGILVLRFIQNHLMLLDSSPSGGYPLNVSELRSLKNFDLDTVLTRKELKYKNVLPTLPSQPGFKSLKQLAPAQFLFNGTNVTMDFQITEQPTSDGEYLCALLNLQSSNHSRIWDMDSCLVERLSDPSIFRCHCSFLGTTALIYAERDSMEVEDAMLDLWIIIYFETSSSHLVVMIGLIVLSARWYRRRTVWAWLQIQLGVSLLPMSSAYFLQAKVVASDPYWTILLTLTTYLYVTTVVAMMMQLKIHSQRVNESITDSSKRRSLRLIGLSLGVPLALSGVQTLLDVFSVSSTFVSWLFQLDSISGIIFCLIYCSLLLVVVVLYVLSSKRIRELDKIDAYTSYEKRSDVNSAQYNYCCLALIGLSLLLTGSMLSRFELLSLYSHCVAATFHLLAIMMWSTLMLTFSGTGYVCAFWCFWHKSKLPGGETVSEMLNATALVESPQRRNLLLPEQRLSNGDGTANTNRTRRISHESTDDGDIILLPRNKRSKRSGQASSPLLQRAGLGPDVLRAFGLEQSHSLASKQSERMQGTSSDTNEPIGLMGGGRNRINSSTTSEGMQRDDIDSGFGPSGGGGSQKLNGLDKFSDAMKFLSRIRRKFPQLAFPSNRSTSCGGSFRSRQSTMSFATTAEFGGERGSSMTTEETEIPLQVAEDAESLMAPYRLRRSRTRWTEDYGQENELDSSDVGNLTIMCKPYRGRCFIRCSPEKIGSNALWGRQCHNTESRDRLTRGSLPHSNCCERCWHNPETPYCDLCLMDNPLTQHRTGTISVQAVIENPPELPEKDICEYLKMDPAGSLAVEQQRIKRVQVYYNVTQTAESNRNNKDKLLSSSSSKSSISPSLLRPKKILSGRIVKKYRLSLRNVVHSTQQQWRQRGRQDEIGPAGHLAERLSLRDQI